MIGILIQQATPLDTSHYAQLIRCLRGGDMGPVLDVGTITEGDPSEKTLCKLVLQMCTILYDMQIGLCLAHRPSVKAMFNVYNFETKKTLNVLNFPHSKEPHIKDVCASVGYWSMNSHFFVTVTLLLLGATLMESQSQQCCSQENKPSRSKTLML